MYSILFYMHDKIQAFVLPSRNLSCLLGIQPCVKAGTYSIFLVASRNIPLYFVQAHLNFGLLCFISTTAQKQVCINRRVRLRPFIILKNIWESSFPFYVPYQMLQYHNLSTWRFASDKIKIQVINDYNGEITQ